MYASGEVTYGLAALFVALAGFTNIAENLKRSSMNRSEEDQRIGYRLSFRMGMYGAVLVVFPSLLADVTSSSTLNLRLSTLLFISILIGEVIHNLKISYASTLTGGDYISDLRLFIFGMGGASILILGLTIHLIDLSYIREWYRGGILWLLIFVIAHFTIYSHSDWASSKDTNHSNENEHGEAVSKITIRQAIKGTVSILFR